jgi:hypothetical protein
VRLHSSEPVGAFRTVSKERFYLMHEAQEATLHGYGEEIIPAMSAEADATF